MNFVILAFFFVLGLAIIAGIVANLFQRKPARTRAEILRDARRACARVEP